MVREVPVHPSRLVDWDRSVRPVVTKRGRASRRLWRGRDVKIPSRHDVSGIMAPDQQGRTNDKATAYQPEKGSAKANMATDAALIGRRPVKSPAILAATWEIPRYHKRNARTLAVTE